VSAHEDVVNWELFVWSLYQLGGADHFVDIEDVSLRCFDIAPARFSWRTRADLPDFKKTAKALQEAEARWPKLLVKTGDSFGRRLTVEGQEWISANSPRLKVQFESGAPVPEPRTRPTSRLLAEIERTDLFRAWEKTRKLPDEKWQMAELLHCSPDSCADIWTARMETARATAKSANNERVLHFLEAVFATHRDWFRD